MSSRLPAALMLSGAGRYPFNGAFERRWAQGQVRLDLAGRIAASSSPEVTWQIVLQLHEALQDLGGADRLSAIRSVWDRLLTLPRHQLGPAQGTDLSLLVVAEDPAGTSVAAVGLEMVWTWSEDRVQPLVGTEHPLLAPPGIPRLPPGALTLDSRPSGPLIAAAVGVQSLTVDTPQETLARCGVSR